VSQTPQEVGVGVAVATGGDVFVAVFVGAGVFVFVGAGVSVGDDVLVGMSVGVKVGVDVSVGVCVGVGVGTWTFKLMIVSAYEPRFPSMNNRKDTVPVGTPIKSQSTTSSGDSYSSVNVPSSTHFVIPAT